MGCNATEIQKIIEAMLEWEKRGLHQHIHIISTNLNMTLK